MTPVSETNLDVQALQDGIAFHAKLNPTLWQNDDMKLEVKVSLLKAAYEFLKFIDMEEIKIRDVIFTGSNAAFNYTSFSDLDVHLIVDFDRTLCPDIAENFFNTKKTLWNQTRHVTIKGYELEMYVEDTKEPVTAAGVYSLLHGEWIKKPKPETPSIDDSAVIVKIESMADQVEELLGGQPSKEAVKSMLNRLRKMRKAGLAKGGEFSVENLAFKGLRNLGFMDKLWNAYQNIEDQSLSLESAIPTE